MKYANFAFAFQQFSHVCTNVGFLSVFIASQTEITRRLEKSSNFENDDSKCEGRCLLSRNQIPHGEHPLSLGKTSVWNQFFQVTSSVLLENRSIESEFTHAQLNCYKSCFKGALVGSGSSVPFLKASNSSSGVCVCVFLQLSNYARDVIEIWKIK